MDSSNKHVSRVFTVLAVIVVIALVIVVMRLTVGGQTTPSPSPVVSAIPPAAPGRAAGGPSASPPVLPKHMAPKAPTMKTALLMLTAADLDGKSALELQMARNAIYARHGYLFHSPELLAYFRAKRWYQPDTGNRQTVEKRFSSTETANVALLIVYENQQNRQ